MSVLIKGMEMPKRGHTATITIVGSGQAYVEYFDCRPHVKETIEYAAVPVPPHGRLGDFDALIEKVIAKYIEHERKGEFVFAAAEIKQDIVDLISNAPTIIEAEEGE